MLSYPLRGWILSGGRENSGTLSIVMDRTTIPRASGETSGHDFRFTGLGEGFLKLKNDNKIDSKFSLSIFRSRAFRLTSVPWDGSWFGFQYMVGFVPFTFPFSSLLPWATENKYENQKGDKCDDPGDIAYGYQEVLICRKYYKSSQVQQLDSALKCSQTWYWQFSE